MTKPVLIVEDDEVQQQTLTGLLRRKLDFGSVTVGNGHEALKILEDASTGAMIKLVIMDIQMPVMDGLEALDIIRRKYPALPVIMLTGSKDLDNAVKAMKLGAVDFINKPYQAERFAITVKNALKLSTLSKEVSRLQNTQEGRFTFQHMIGHNKGLSSATTMGRKAASADIPVLITGETGTGKEIFAQAIHGQSSRAGKPFIAVNCGAIPSQLVESTLFGHEKGAFTDATEKKIGKFREAAGGTIFLDEVGELPLDTQVKLLRVLQQKEVEPVGGGKPVPVDIRIISATNRDLQKEVENGNFREDLFFRLNVLHINLPPLRERKSDIPELTFHLIERFCAREGALQKNVPDQTLNKLIAYDWPGNVRQLENTVNRAMVLSETSALEIDDLQGNGQAPDTASFTANSPAFISENGNLKTMREIEKEAMSFSLSHFDHNVTRAAKALGMAKSTFYKKMQNL